jgi:hypothetical protein
MTINRHLTSAAIAGILLGGGIFFTTLASADPVAANVCAQTCNDLPFYEKQTCLAACQGSGSGPSCKDLVGSAEADCLDCCDGGVDLGGQQVGGCVEAQPSTPASHAAYIACVQGCRAGCSGKKPGPLPATPAPPQTGD